MRFLTNVDLNKNQLNNAALQNLGTAPSSPVKGQAYFNTGDNNGYVWDGTAWKSITNSTGLTGAQMVTSINASASLIDDDNLSANVNDAITKKHAQNTDIGTSSTTFQVGTGGPKVKNNAGTLEARNSGDTAYANIQAQGATVDSITVATTATLPASTTIGGVTQANISSAVTLKHSQNTDLGTSNASFYVGTTSGVLIKNNAGAELQVRNGADTAFADLRVNNLTVDGATTTINSNIVNIGDNQITLNSDVVTFATNSSGGIAVKRLMADNSTRKDAELNFNNSTYRWESVMGDVAAALVTAQLTNKVVTAIGDGATTAITVTHNLNTRDITVAVRETAGTFAIVYPDIEMTTVNMITVKFATAPASNEFTVTVIG